MKTRGVYGRETVPVVTAAESAAHDRMTQQQFGLPERALMENAARALALIIHKLYPHGLVVGVAGGGNNGGDTAIAIDALSAWGRDTRLIRTSDGAADVAAAFAGAGVILDGIFGTGASGTPRADAAALIRAMNASGRPIVAVDVPSGANPDTGVVYDDVVTADTTVCFGFPKLGLLFHPARAHCGRLIVVDIGFPPLAEPKAQLITRDWAAARLPQRPATANKGTSGRLLLLAGSTGMAGAAVLAGSAAVRSGVGLIRIVSPAANREILQKAVPEATFLAREEPFETAGFNAIVAGPGMGDSDETRALVLDTLRSAPGVPALLDADGLNVFSGDIDALAALARNRPLLITPHPKEMGRLTGASIDEVVAAPLDAARALAQKTGATVLLKGQPTIIVSAGEPALITSLGSSDFAVAGMGDQLAGVIGTMLAAGLDMRTAAGVALYYNGRAGDIANAGRALTPTIVTEHIAAAFADAGPSASDLDLPFITFDQAARW